MRIAVVGAGSAGMAMAKQVMEVTQGQAHIVLFERRAEVGGIWQYEGEVEEGRLAWEYDDGSLSGPIDKSTPAGRRLRYTCSSGKTWHQPGPMFEGLRTNIPCDLMSYRDSPFPDNTDLFPSRGEVQAYLEGYASEHALRRCVRFGVLVKRVVKDQEGNAWRVESENVKNGSDERSELFSHVVLAHGRCSTPNIPQIPGIETFSGRIMHSAWYRDPTFLFRDAEPRRVLVVGNASSGMDIARELSGFVKRALPCGLSESEWDTEWQAHPIQVLSSWHSPDKPPPMDYNPQDLASPEWCRRIEVVPSIEQINGSSITLADGSVLSNVPLIIFATGYLFDCPFLDQTSGALRKYPLLPPSTNVTRSGFPSPSMYNMDDWLLMHAHDESMAVLGLPVTVVPFPFVEIQARYVIQRWLGKALPLPRLDTDLGVNDEQRWLSRRQAVEVNGFSSHSDHHVLNTTAHVFGTPSDNTYLDQLLSLMHAGQPPPWLDRYTSDGMGNGTPRGPEDMFAVAPWRRERRNNGRVLRRATLGY